MSKRISSHADVRLHDNRDEQNSGELEVVYPFDCSKWHINGVYTGNEYIAVVHKVFAFPLNQCQNRCLGYVIQLYDRWTLQLVNAISMRATDNFFLRSLGFIDHSVLIHQESVDENAAIVSWNQAIGKMHTVWSSTQWISAHKFCVSKLVVLLKLSQPNQAVVSVYKYGSETARAPELIIDDEPLQMSYFSFGSTRSPRGILSDESVDVFGIVGRDIDSRRVNIYQLRSKNDFSLRSIVVDERDLMIGKTHLLSDRFIFAKDGKWLSVFSLVSGKVRKVYAFRKPRNPGLRQPFEYVDEEFFLDGNLLVLHRDARKLNSSARCRRSVAIWKLPPDFIATCSRHLEKGTVGSTRECDQHIITEYSCQGRHARALVTADRFGLTRISNAKSGDAGQQALHVFMFNSVISDEGY